MAKRNKAKFASKSRKSALRIEALEQRQLLAAVTGGGTEVGSNIVHPNGNVYDQVLMTGASVTVSSDAGQVTRVSFLDLNGDIVQAEFAGKGSLTITLDQFKAAAEAAGYNQPGVKYVGGLATFTIQGEDSSTNFNVFTVGSGNAINQDLFAGGKTGGTNHIADIARILIVADPAAPGGSTMGGIRAGNAIFSDSTGVVGISAANVQTQGPVVVGDIDASNAGVPTLKFGANSQFATLIVAGGDLVQTNGTVVQGSGFSSINSQAGADSTVEARPGFTPGAANIGSKVIAAGAVDIDPNTAGTQAPTITTLDSITSFDLTGKTQADITAAFAGRTFTNDITISGDLSGVNSLSAAEFRGAVTFTGTLSGNVTVDGQIKALTLNKTNSDTISAASIGSITTTGTANLGGTIVSKSIGAVTVGGSLTGTVSTDFDGGVDFDQGETKIGDISVGANMSGSVFGVLGIGNVTINGNLTSTGTAFRTFSGTTGDAFLGNIGTINVKGFINQNATATLINISQNGTFGDITDVGGAATTSTHTIGGITVAGSLGASGTTTGKITINDAAPITTNAWTFGGNGAASGTVGAISITSTNGALTTGALEYKGSIGSGDISLSATAGNVTTGTIKHTTGAATMGNLTITGSSLKSSTVTLGAIDLTAGTSGTAGSTLGNLTISGSEQIALGTIALKNIGTVSATIVDKGAGVAQTINTAGILANAGTGTATIGGLTLNAGTFGTVNVNGNVNTFQDTATGSASIGAVNLTGSAVNIGVTAGAMIESSKIGAVTLTGTSTVGDGTKASGFKALGSIASLTSVGDLALKASSTVSSIQGGAIGALTVNGFLDMSGANGGAPAILGNNGTSTLDSIASITVNGRVAGKAGSADIKASSIGDINITTALTTNQALVTNLNVVATNNGMTTGSTDSSTAETVATDGSNLANYAIGNITVQSTNTIGIAGTSLFSGANSFNAIGKIGNVTLAAGGSSAVQSSLFAGATGHSLTVGVGNGNVIGAANAVQLTGSGIDFDGSGVVGNTGGTFTTFDSNVSGATESGSVFTTAATVSIGNITINAAKGTPTDSVGALGQANATYTDGLVVLSGTKGNGTFTAATGVITGGDFRVGTTQDVSAIAGNLRGTVGNVTVTNLSQQLSVQGPYAAITGITTPENAGLIAATSGGGTASPYGTINGRSTGASDLGFDATTNKKAVLVGNDGNANEGSTDTLVVVRV